MFKRIYLGLGSNLGEAPLNIIEAVRQLNADSTIRNSKLSPLYLTPPMGPQDQPDFINAVLQAETQLSPFELLAKIKLIEKTMGRQITHRWGPRVIDIDILLYGDQIIRSDELNIPHIGLSERSFVLYPLADLDNQLQVPELASITELIHNLGKTEIRQIQSVD